MDKVVLKSVVTEIFNQIFWSIDKWAYFSWGVSSRGFMVYNNMPTLVLRVSGLVHKGWVYVSLNEGTDTYEVRLFSVKGHKQKGEMVECFCDNLGQILDSLIEKPLKLTDDEYKKKALADSARKWNK